MKIPLASSGLRQKDIQAAIEVLNSGNLTMGKKVREFENSMAKYLKVEHFIMMNSGSSANLAMFEGLLRPTTGHPKLKQGDRILVPVIAWPTTIWPIIQLGLEPIFIDIDTDTFAIDLDEAQKFLDRSNVPTQGIFPIHPLGRSINSEKLDNFCKKNNLVLINDVCEALGSWSYNTHAGVIGMGGSFSFYFSHHITTMGGGVVATNNSDFADDLRSIRSHGWSRDRTDSAIWQQNLSRNDSKFLFVSTGFNIRPMEMQAAIGISQLEDLDQFINLRRQMAQKIHMSINGTGIELVGASTLTSPRDEKSNSWMLMPIRVLGNNAESRKKKIIQNLENLGVETRPVLTGNFISQPSMQRIGKNLPNANEFIQANAISDSTFLVSGHHDLSNVEIDFLCQALISSALSNQE